MAVVIRFARYGAKGKPFYRIVAAESAPFKVKGGITLTAPTNGSTWFAGETTNVAWSYTGTIGTFNIYYNTDNTNNFPVENLIGTKNGVDCSGGACTFAWGPDSAPIALPSNVTNQLKVKITNSVDETDTKAIGTNAKISAKFEVTSPENGSPVYAGDTGTTVNWNIVSGTGIGNIKVYYSNADIAANDPGWILIGEVGGGATSIDWNPVPGASADLSTVAHRVKVTQSVPNNETVAYNLGGGVVFPIKAVLTVTNPSTGSESWDVNTTQTVKFTKRGELGTVNLWYSYDGGSGNYVKINPSALDVSLLADNTEYSYAWAITGSTALTNGLSGRIEARAATPGEQLTLAVKSLPSSAFEVKGALSVVNPNLTAHGPLTYTGSATHDIQWTPLGAITQVKLYYFTTFAASGSCAGGIAINSGNPINATPSTFTWLVPNSIGSNLQICVEDAGNDRVYKRSAEPFEIKGSVAIEQPDTATQQWYIGNTYQILWRPTGTYAGTTTPNVEFHYSTAGTPDYTGNLITTVANVATGAQGSVDWNIPTNIPVTATGRVRVRVVSSPNTPADETSVPFKILGQISAITGPTDGEVWYAEDTQRQIKWTAIGNVTNVKITFNDGVDKDIVLNDGGHAHGNNQYTWSAGIPIDVKSESVTVTVCDKDYPTLTTLTSPFTFRIRPKMQVNSPIITDQWVVGSTTNLIQWSVLQGNTVTSFDIYYSTDNGQNYNPTPIFTEKTIQNGIDGVAWTVPNAISSQVKIKVVDHTGYPTVSPVAVESAPFKIALLRNSL